MNPAATSQAEDTQLRKRIRVALEAMADAPSLDVAARHLLETVGYPTDKTLAGQTGRVDDFLELHLPGTGFQKGTRAEQALRGDDPVIKLLCQVTNDNLDLLGQQTLVEQPDIQEGLHESFLFVTADLQNNSDTYRRSTYTQHTREINKRFLMPTVVLYRTRCRHLTIAFIKRRQDKHDRDRDVLGTVSLIRDIDLRDPHRAHLSLLGQLSLPALREWMDSHDQAHNFDGLDKAWRATLDTDLLNKQFYHRLFKWYERATTEATFPATGGDEAQQEVQVIRLITRLLFIWFMKEKGLVAPELFIKRQAMSLLRDYDPHNGDTYYPAILQNLFFATLNTEYDQPGSRRSPNHYLYRDLIADPDGLVRLFDQTPFINGGLFDRLDTDIPEHPQQLSVPNRLFFDDPDGIITLLDDYKFTLEENTPIDQDVALDPELLGKVFENLLAAHNPETRTTVRKLTGSYYTPRPIVDYMVDEALALVLTESCHRNAPDVGVPEDLLRRLLDHGHEFEQDPADRPDEVRQAIVESVASIKILDPAVGSGAFPMAILHKLTLVLQRVDPYNELWEHFQLDIASQRAADALATDDQTERDQQLLAISSTFEKYRTSDYGRKLYLIQNSIYGVDIQPIACLIAKLRFFIALAIDQTPDPTDNNRGIRPLPNLETKFVAADTLIGLQGQRVLIPPAAEDLLEQLDRNRERHFLAVPSQKEGLKREHQRLRSELSDQLAAAGMPSEQTGRIERWDPYEQETAATWFHPHYMFGVEDGFDVVIGNPPYIQLQDDGGRLADRYESARFAVFSRSGDIYYLFYEKGVALLKPNRGVLTYITSRNWMKTQHGEKLRSYLSAQTSPIALLDLGKGVFDATVSTNILLLRAAPQQTARPFPSVRVNDGSSANLRACLSEGADTIRPEKGFPWASLSPLEVRAMDKMRARGTPLAQWNLGMRRGVLTGFNRAFVIGSETRNRLVEREPHSRDLIVPVLRGGDTKRYRAEWGGKYLIATHNGYDDVPAVNLDHHPAVKDHLQRYDTTLRTRADQGRTPYNLRSCAYWHEFSGEKLIWMDLTPEGRFCYDDGSMLPLNTAFVMYGPSLKYLCAVLNSRAITWFMANTALRSGQGTPRWVIFTVKRIPIPIIPRPQQEPFARLLDTILSLKETNPEADTRHQEAEIDRMVYQLYDFTDEEITAVVSSQAY